MISKTFGITGGAKSHVGRGTKKERRFWKDATGERKTTQRYTGQNLIICFSFKIINLFGFPH